MSFNDNAGGPGSESRVPRDSKGASNSRADFCVGDDQCGVNVGTMRELKTLGALGYWLLTFEVTLPFFDKAGAPEKKAEGWTGGEKKSSGKSAITGATSGVGQEREMRDGYKS